MHFLRTKVLWAIAALLALNAVLLAAAPGAALPRGLAAYLLGPKLVRAEVIVRDGGSLRDYILHQGRIRQIRPASLTLREADGTTVVVPVADTAHITLGGRTVPFGALRRGMVAMTAQEGSAPAELVRAFRRAP